MSILENSDNILLLKKLLCPDDKNGSSSESDDDCAPINKLNPGSIGPKSQSRKKKNNNPRHIPLEKEESDIKTDADIDKWLEKQEKEDGETLENRKRPEYTITYKQAVGTEDIFLQMGNKTNASSSCEDMIIEIKLPEETVDVCQMNISVTEKEIDLATPVYRLKLPLTQPINPDKSSAKYFTEQKTLCLTCRMNRELDFVNF